MLNTVIWLAAILKFKMATFTKLTNSINTGFIDLENMGLDTKIKSMCALQTEIWAKYDFIGGHFETKYGCQYQVSEVSNYITVAIY
jgi:hypothetical protein